MMISLRVPNLSKRRRSRGRGASVEFCPRLLLGISWRMYACIGAVIGAHLRMYTTQAQSSRERWTDYLRKCAGGTGKPGEAGFLGRFVPLHRDIVLCIQSVCCLIVFTSPIRMLMQKAMPPFIFSTNTPRCVGSMEVSQTSSAVIAIMFSNV